MRHNAHTVKYNVPKTTKPNRPKAQKVRPSMGKTMSGRAAKTHVAGRMAGTILTAKQRPFKAITQDVRRLQKAHQPALQTPKSNERQGAKGKKTYPVVVKGEVIGQGVIIKAKTWGTGRNAKNRCLVAIDGRPRGWAQLINGRLIIITEK